MLSWPNKWEHASFGRNETSVELARKNIADLHCKFFMQHRNKKTSHADIGREMAPTDIFQPTLRNFF